MVRHGTPVRFLAIIAIILSILSISISPASAQSADDQVEIGTSLAPGTEPQDEPDGVSTGDTVPETPAEEIPPTVPADASAPPEAENGDDDQSQDTTSQPTVESPAGEGENVPEQQGESPPAADDAPVTPEVDVEEKTPEEPAATNTEATAESTDKSASEAKSVESNAVCDPLRTFTRDVTIYYGTISDSDGHSLDGLQLTDHLEAGLRFRIEHDASLDPRVTGGIGTWNTVNQSSVEWVQGAPEGLDPMQELAAQYAIYAMNEGGIAVPSVPVDQGTVEYVIASFVTQEQCGDEVVNVDNQFIARVSFTEMNATAVFEQCEIEVETYFARSVTVYYGTITGPNNLSADGVQFSDHIYGTVKTRLDNDSSLDPRVAAAVAAWTTPNQNAIEWTLDTPEGLDAKQALLDSFTEFAANQGGAASLGDETGRGLIDIVLSEVDSVVPCGDGFVIALQTYVARVTFVELNATVEIDSCASQRTFVRNLDIVFGTIPLPGNPTKHESQYSDHIQGGLRLRLEQDSSLDPRAIAGIASWATLNQTSVEWVQGAPEGLDPMQELLTQYAIYAMNEGGIAVPSVPVDQGTVEYVIASFVTQEQCGDEVVNVDNQFIARVSFTEMNATIAFEQCEPRVETIARPMTIYYGTITGPDNLSADGVQFSDHIQNVVQFVLEHDSTVDPRVVQAVAAWTTLDENALDWVLNSPEGLDAKQALLASFSAFASNQSGNVSLGEETDRGTVDYALATIGTADPCGDGFVIGTITYAARVTFVELNATVEFPEPAVLTFRVVDQDGNPIGGVCFAVSNGSAAFQPCSDADGTVWLPMAVAEEPVTGTFAFTFEEGPIRCTPPSLDDIVVDTDDLGSVIDLGDLVFSCEEGGFDDCMRTQDIPRPLGIYYGTLRDADGNAILDGLELTDHIGAALRVHIQQLNVDPRVTNGVVDWDNQSTNFEWIIATPENLDAQAVLLAAFAAAANGGTVVPDSAIVSQTEILLESAFAVPEDNAFCSTGQRQIFGRLLAAVTFFELNATVQTDPCAPREETITRDLTDYFGTVSVAGGGPSQDALSLSDRISIVLQDVMEADDIDPRAVIGLDAWTDPVGGIEWVLAPPENLDARAGLIDDFDEFSDAHGGGLVLDDEIDRGTIDYWLVITTTFVEVAGCDPGIEVTTTYAARVHFVELNAMVDVEDDTGAPDGNDGQSGSDGAANTNDQQTNVTKLPVTGVGQAYIPRSDLLALMLGLLPLFALVVVWRFRKSVLPR